MNKAIEDYIKRCNTSTYQYESVSLHHGDLKILIAAMKQLGSIPTFKNMVKKGFALNNHEKNKSGMRIGR